MNTLTKEGHGIFDERANQLTEYGRGVHDMAIMAMKAVGDQHAESILEALPLSVKNTETFIDLRASASDVAIVHDGELSPGHGNAPFLSEDNEMAVRYAEEFAKRGLSVTVYATLVNPDVERMAGVRYLPLWYLRDEERKAAHILIDSHDLPRAIVPTSSPIFVRGFYLYAATLDHDGFERVVRAWGNFKKIADPGCFLKFGISVATDGDAYEKGVIAGLRAHGLAGYWFGLVPQDHWDTAITTAAVVIEDRKTELMDLKSRWYGFRHLAIEELAPRHDVSGLVEALRHPPVERLKYQGWTVPTVSAEVDRIISAS